jgi:hypothetical protein
MDMVYEVPSVREIGIWKELENQNMLNVLIFLQSRFARNDVTRNFDYWFQSVIVLLGN